MAQTPDFKASYLEGNLNQFYSIPIQNGQGNAQQALDLPRPIDRVNLVSKLSAYATKLSAPPEVFKALDALSHEDSRAIVTGQQVGLLLGPNFTLSKAVTAIKKARQLSSEEKPVVAVFWLASQDHDSEEINHNYFMDMDERLGKLELPLAEGIPAGRLSLEKNWLTQLQNDIKALNYPQHFKDEVLNFIADSFEKTTTFDDFFASMLYKLLGPEGLIIINPLDEDTASLFKDIIKAELANPLASSEAINAAAEELQLLGHTPQLGRAEAATNLFIEEANQQRQLLRTVDGKFFFSDDSEYTLDALHKILEETPSRITPAAGFRPITQDSVLPTAMTVVGPGELKYFAQIKGVFDLHNVPMPLIYPRMTVTIIEPPVQRIMQKYDLSLEQLAKFQSIKEELILTLEGHSESFTENLIKLEETFKALLSDIKNIDVTLTNPVMRTDVHFNEILQKLKTKSAKALLKQDSIVSNQFRRLDRHLAPEGAPQERLISPLSFMLKFGVEVMVKEFMELEPEGDHQIIL